jgi:pentatricopeptide repeat protein
MSLLFSSAAAYSSARGQRQALARVSCCHGSWRSERAPHLPSAATSRVQPRAARLPWRMGTDAPPRSAEPAPDWDGHQTLPRSHKSPSFPPDGPESTSDERTRVLALANENEPERALALCTTLYQRGVAVDTHAYTSILNAYRHRGDADGVVHVLGVMAARGVPASDVTALLAFRALRDARRADAVVRAVQLIESSGGTIGLRGWSNALSCLAERIRSLPASHPDLDTYTKAGWKVLARMQRMRQHRKPNAYVFNSWMAMYASRGDWDGAMAVFGAMVAGARVCPDVVSYNILFECLARRFARTRVPAERDACRKLEAALVESMRLHGIEPDARTLSAQLRLVEHDLHAVRAIERRALWYGVRLDSFYVNALIDAYARIGEPAAAATVLERLAVHHDQCQAAAAQGRFSAETAACPTALPPITAYALNGVLKACARTGDAERAWKLVQGMEERFGIQPDAISFTCAITAAGKAYATTLARHLYEQARERLSDKANVRLATAAILAEHEDPEPAIRVFERLLRDAEKLPSAGASLSGSSASGSMDLRVPVQALVRVCGRARAPARAREIILAVKRRRLCFIDLTYYQSFMKGVQESQERRRKQGIRDLTPLSPLSAPSLYLLKLECTALGDTPKIGNYGSSWTIR